MKKRMIAISLSVIFYFLVFVGSTKNNRITHYPKSESGWKAEDCQPTQPWANMGTRCTSDPNGACTARNTKCKPFSIAPGGSVDELNQFGTDYEAIKRYLINTWSWPEANADSLILFLRYGGRTN